MRQVEVSRTLVFDAPRHARGFFEALVADNLDIGRPDNVELIFHGPRRTGRPPKLDCVAKTKVVTRGTEVTVNAFYKSSRIKQYLKDGRALRIETVVNCPDDLRCQRRLVHLDELQARARAINRRLLDTERVGQGCVLASPAFERIARATLTEDGGKHSLRTWWRRLHGDSDAELDNTHLMRMAGRFARRVKAWGAASGVPVIFCKAGERKHRIAEQYLATHDVGVGVFLVLVAKAPAPVWKVTRSAAGRIVNIDRRREYVNHYSFHIIDPQWGHVTIKMSGHPPFGAQIILNGHEYVARQAAAAGIAFTKAGNCFTAVADPAGLARIADALSQDAAVGRLGQVCQRWIYTACLCFGLDLDEQHKSGFGYGFAVYQPRIQPQPDLRRRRDNAARL